MKAGMWNRWYLARGKFLCDGVASVRGDLHTRQYEEEETDHLKGGETLVVEHSQNSTIFNL